MRWTLITLLICISALAAQAAEDIALPGLHEFEIDHAQRNRRALVFVPAKIASDAEAQLPLVLAFHGGGGSAEGYREYAGFEGLASREGFIVVYPEGMSRAGFLTSRFHTWNAGKCCGYASRENVDDVGFVNALLDSLIQKLPVDASRVYATGHSNGAMMSYRLAAESGDRIAAIAAVAGAMSLESFSPARPVPVLHIHSVDDPRALYDGGLGPPFPMTNSRVHHGSVESELNRWREHNGCSGDGATIDQRPAPKERVDSSDSTDSTGSAANTTNTTNTTNSPDEGHTAILLDYAPCASGAPVRLWRLSGPGHGWPGRAAMNNTSARRVKIIGPPSAVIDAAAEAWAFFRVHSLTEPIAPDPDTNDL
jgi:polyhydroxybutyrate depolymerase